MKVAVIATSAGGLRALTEVLSGLPGDFPAPILVVQHLHPTMPNMLATILGRRCALTITEAEDGASIVGGTVYVAVRDRHLTLRADGTLSLTDSRRVHFSRPSADVLFESAAASYGSGVVAVVLTGAGVDGASGVQAVKRAGGIVIAQDEATSDTFGMPAAAIATHDVDRVVPLGDISDFLVAAFIGAGDTAT